MVQDASDLQRNFIDGQWREGRQRLTRANRNPADPADLVGEFTESTAEDVADAVEAARRAFPAWRDLGPIARGEFLRRVGRILADRAEEFAAAITREQGKLLREARGEVTRTLAILEFTQGEARRINGVHDARRGARTLAMTFRAPIGVTG